MSTSLVSWHSWTVETPKLLRISRQLGKFVLAIPLNERNSFEKTQRGLARLRRAPGPLSRFQACPVTEVGDLIAACIYDECLVGPSIRTGAVNFDRSRALRSGFRV